MSKIIQLEAGKIKANPFKKFISGGKLAEDRVEKMEESIEHGTLPMHFFVRNIDDNYELAHGHHRLEAVKRKKGKAFKVSCEVVDYNDETMLIDMVRENLTHRDTDFHDLEDSVVLARQWLTIKEPNVSRFDSRLKVLRDKKTGQLKGSESLPDSPRSIAKFLSKQGKTISHETIRNYLQIHDNLHPDLLEKVEKIESASDEEREKKIGVRIATELSTVERKDQKILAKQIKDEGLNFADSVSAINKFKKADDKIKGKVRSGKLKVTKIDSPIDMDYIREEAKRLAKETEEIYEIMKKEHPEDFVAMDKETKQQFKMMMSFMTISSLLDAKMLYCPHHKKTELVWKCCSEKLQDSRDFLKKKFDEGS